MSNYAVTLNYNCHYGYVEYNEADKTAVVTLPDIFPGTPHTASCFLQSAGRQTTKHLLLSQRNSAAYSYSASCRSAAVL